LFLGQTLRFTKPKILKNHSHLAARADIVIHVILCFKLFEFLWKRKVCKQMKQNMKQNGRLFCGHSKFHSDSKSSLRSLKCSFSIDLQQCGFGQKVFSF